MPEGRRGEQASARGALQETFLDQERFDDVLDGVARLGKRGGKRIDADRSATVAFRDCLKIAPIHRVEASLIDLQLAERMVGELAVDRLGAIDMGEIAHPPQQPGGDARGAARTPRDLVGTVDGHANTENAGAAVDDLLELGLAVKI